MLGKENAEYARSVSNLGALYKDLGRYEEAESYTLEAKDIRARVLGTQHLDYARSLNNLAVINMSRGRLAAAEPLMLEVKSIREKALGKDHPEYAKIVANLAALYLSLGRLASAEPMMLESKDIRERTLGKDHPDYARSVNDLATLYTNSGRHALAEPLMLESLSIREKKLGKNNPQYTESLGNLAAVYIGMGRLDAAEPYMLESKNIREKILGKDHPDYALSLNNLAALYVEMARYESAEPLYQEALLIWEKKLGNEHPTYAIGLGNYANLLWHLGRQQAAEATTLKALNVLEKTVGKEHQDYIRCLVSLGNYSMEKGAYSDAERIYKEIKSIQEKKIGTSNHEYAASLLNLATLYGLMKRHSEAKQIGLEAVAIEKRVTDKNNSNYAQALSNMAILLGLMGESEQAWQMNQEAYTLVKENLGENNVVYARCIQNQAVLYRSMMQPEKAAPFYLEARAIQRRLLSNSSRYLSEQEWSDYAATFIHELDDYFSFAQTYASKSPEIVGDCYDNALFHKGFLLLTAKNLRDWAQNDTTLTKLDILQKSYLRRLAREFAKPGAEMDNVRINEWKEMANGIEKEIIRKYSAYSTLLKPVNWQEVKQKIPKDGAAIEFITYRYHSPVIELTMQHPRRPTEADTIMYAALVLLPDDTTPRLIPLFEENEMKDLLNRPGLDEELIIKSLYSSSSELGRMIWQPIEPYLRNVHTVFYSPSGILHQLNLAALRDESGELVSKNRQWVSVGSTRELIGNNLADLSFARNLSNHNISSTACIFGGITYDMDSTSFVKVNTSSDVGETTAERNEIIKMEYATQRQTDSGKGETLWQPLEGSNDEADRINEFLRHAGFQTNVYKGLAASEERVRQLEAEGARILHFATHGFAYPDPKNIAAKYVNKNTPIAQYQDDPMLRSGLVLAGANYYWKNKRPLGNHEDGILLAYEVRDLNLRNTELAVLSACQTGLGDVVGSEGVYGLQRAFRMAGVKFLIVSLWHVPDEQTQELMRLFYGNWLEKKESLRDAFNHAQEVLREKEPNPYLWAGFVLIE